MSWVPILLMIAAVAGIGALATGTGNIHPGDNADEFPKRILSGSNHLGQGHSDSAYSFMGKRHMSGLANLAYGKRHMSGLANLAYGKRFMSGLSDIAVGKKHSMSDGKRFMSGLSDLASGKRKRFMSGLSSLAGGKRFLSGMSDLSHA